MQYFTDLVHFDVRQPRTGLLAVRVVLRHYADAKYGGNYVHLLVNKDVSCGVVDIVRANQGVGICLFNVLSRSL